MILRAPGVIYYIANGGSDAADGLSPATAKQTVDAVNGAVLAPGDQVLFNRGDSWATENLVVPSSGFAGRPIVFGAYGTGARPILKSALAAAKNYLVFHQLRISASAAFGFDLAATDTVEISSVEVDTCVDTGILLSAGAQNITIQDSAIHGNGTGGTDNDGIGIGGGGAASHHIVIERNDIYANNASNVRVSMTSALATPHDITVRYNRLRDSVTAAGFAADAGESLLLHHNLITGNAAHIGIFVVPAFLDPVTENVTLLAYNNVIVGNGYGFMATTGGGGTATVTLKNNISYENLTYEFNLTGTPTIISDFNLVYHSAGGNFMFAGGAGTWAQWQSILSPLDASSVNANPAFTNPGAGDYTLQAGSPAINAGTSVGLTTDYLGNPLVALPDIGAYERQYSYYISNSGSDAANGLSPETAKQTVAAVNGMALMPGDQVLFNRGNVWRETLTTPTSGTTGRPITYGAYGSGVRPIISGADVVTGLVVGAANVWSGTLATEPAQVFVNGERGQRMASSGAVVSHRQWHWAANVLTVFGTGGAEPDVEASVRDNAVVLSEQYITLDGLDLARGAIHTVTGSRTGTRIRNSILRDAFIDNFRAASGTEYVGVVIEDNEIYGAGDSGITVNENSLDARIRRNDVHHNCNLHHSLVGGDAQQQWSGGIQMWGNGGALDDGAGAIIEDNEVYENGPHAWVSIIGGEGGRGVGIWLDTTYTPSAPIIVRRNWVHDNAAWGIYLEKTRHAHAYYNLTGDNNQSGTFTANLAVQANDFPQGESSDNIAENNTVYGSAWVSVLFGGADAPFSDNILRNNLISPASGIHHLYLQDAGGDSAEGNLINHNLFGDSAAFRVNAVNDVTFGITYTTLAAWQAASGQDADSIYDDPLLVTPNTDLSLQLGSPAINAGTSVGLTTDYVGNPLVGAPDIGAYEHQ